MAKARQAAKAAGRQAKSAAGRVVRTPHIWLEGARILGAVLQPGEGQMRGPSSRKNGTPAAELLKRGPCEPAGARSWADVCIEATLGMAGDDVLAITITAVL